MRPSRPAARRARHLTPAAVKTAIALAAAAALLPAQGASVNWNFAGDGFWDVAGNWAPGAPANGDSVTINVAGLRTITFRSGVLALNSLAVTNNVLALTGGNLTVNGLYTNTGTGRTDISNSGTLTLNGSGILGALTMSNGTLAGSGTVTVNGPANITFGDFRGSGSTVLRRSTTISSSGLRLDGGRTLRNEADLTWSGGQILLNNNIAGTSIPGSGTIDNAADATFTASGNSASSITFSSFGPSDNGADAAFNNAGTFIKTGSTTTNLTSIGIAFNNTGAVQVQTGELSLDGGGTHSGSFSGAGTIVFGGSAAHLLGATSSVSTQDVLFSGSSTTTVNGSYNVSGSTAISGGTVTFASGVTSLGGTLALSGGLMNLGSNNATVAQLTQSGGSLSGTGTLTVTGGANLTFGDHRGSGTTVLQGSSTISSSGFRLDGGRTLRNEGTMTWTSGQLLLNNNSVGTSVPGSGTFTNAAGATFTASGGNATSITFSNFGGTDTGADAAFNNAGSFVKSGSSATGTTTVDAVFNNTGSVDVQTGVLNLNGGGTQSGSFSGLGTLGFGGGTNVVTAAGSVATQNVNFSGSGTTTISGSYNVAGTTAISSGTHSIAGTLSNLGSTLNISGGLLNINASNASVGTLTQSGGSLAGTGTLTVSGNANITFGDQRGSGTTVLQGTTTVSSSGFRLDGGRTLRNEGALTWSGGQWLFNNNVVGTGIPGSGTVNNAAGATFTASGDSANTITLSNFGGTDTGADAAFNNFGTVRKSGSAAANLTTVDVTFNNSGSVDVQTGVLNFSGGGTHSGSFSGTGTVGFGGGTHVVTAAGSVTTQNVNFLGSGTTTVNGGYDVAGTTSVSAGTHSITGSLSNLGAVLNVSGGSLNISSSNANVTTLTQSSGSVGGTGTLTVAGNANLTFGDHRGTGTTILQGASTLTGSGFRLDGGRTLRNEGTFTWSGGQILFNNTFTGAAGGAGSGSIVNASGALFNVFADSATSVTSSNFGGTDTGADAVINNDGTWRKSGSSGTSTTTIDVAFNNTGTVQAQSGVLNFSSGGTHTGSFDVAAGSVLGFSGGTHNLNGGGVTSPGTVRLTGSVAVNVNTGYAIAGTTDIQSGFLNLSGGNASTGVLTQSSGSVAGSNNFTVTGNANLTFGDHRGTGTTILQGASTLTGSGFRLDGGRVLRNEGTFTWSAGQILFNNTFTGASGGAGSGSIVNASGALFNVFADSATSITSSNFGGTDTGADAVINNAGTWRKSGSSGTSTTTIDVAFNNTGTVQVQSGLLNFSNGGTHTGNFDVAAGTTLGFTGGTHNLNAGAITSPGTVRLSGSATVNVNTAYAIAGTTNIQGGFLNLLGGNASTGALTQSSGSVAGANNLTVTGDANLSFGDHRGTGSTILQGNSTLTGSGFRLDGGRTLRNEGTFTWSGGQILFNNTFTGASGGAGSGSIVNASGALFNVFADSATSITTSNFGGTDTGADAVINNAGTWRKSGSSGTSTTTVDVAFNNTGTVQAQTGVLSFSGNTTLAGVLQVDAVAVLRLGTATHTLNAPTTSIAGRMELTSGSLVIAAPTTLSGTGSFNQSTGSVSGADLTIASAANFTFGDHRGSGTTILQGASTLTGSGFRLDGGRVLRNEGTFTWSAGQILLNNNVSGTQIAGSGAINNAVGGVFNVFGDTATSISVSSFGGTDTGADAAVNNAGSFVKLGSTAANNTIVDVAFNNTGTARAQTGVLNFSRGVSGTTGTLQIDAGATMTLSAFGTSSTTGTLINNGTAANSLNLGANTITVFTDYTNAGFGSGNSFNRRANTGITGAGNRIVAGGDANQGITGVGVANGTGTTPTLLIGNGHVGATTFSYGIANTGSTGPALRGAIQTSVNGASLTDARLSGSGVTAGNWGPVTTGTSLARDVTLTINTAGVYSALTGQSVSIVNNFDNTRSQLLTISSASGAAAYNFAAAGAVTPSPVLLANQRVGGANTAALTITNTAPGGSFTEGLNASFASSTGDVLTNSGSISLLAGGASNTSALAVALNTATAGAKSGSATLNFVSDGSGSSGLGTTALASQTVNVSGNVYRLASPGAAAPNPVVFANARVGDSLTRTLTLTNTAAADGFSERLNASIGSATAGFSASGSFTQLAAQATDSSSLTVSLNTGTAGARTGTATITLVSDGTGTSDLAPFALGTQTVNLVGNVFRTAVASVAPNPVSFGNVRVGAAATQTLNVTNSAAADGFSEALNASLGGATAGITASGSFAELAAQASNGSSLVVGIDTATAGARSGTATLTLASSGTNSSGLGTLALAPQTINVSGNVFRLAATSAATPNPVNLGNVRIGSVATQALTLTNTAANDGFSERLNATLGSATAGITASGSFTQLAAQATNNTNLLVGLDTSSAGVKSGSATLALASDGAGTSGLAALALAPQTVNVSGAVYRLANPVLSPTSVTLAARVGDLAPSAAVSLTNSSLDAFTEALNASFGAVAVGFSGSGSVNGLGAGASSSALRLTLNTGAAANISGNATLALVSTGAGTTGAANLALASQNVLVTGRVYAPAQAQVGTPTVDFGIVHVGDVVATRAVSVTNAAPAAALNDTLRGSITTTSPAFTASGSLTDLAAQATNATSLRVGLVTTEAGVFNSGSATASFSSHNADLADLALAPVVVNLRGQVNNFAQATLTASGTGSFSNSGRTYTLDFGSLLLGSGSATAALSVLNSAVGPADLLSGSFDLTAVGPGFTLTGFGSLADLVAGASQGGLAIAFLTDTTGDFASSIVLRASGSNASGYIGALEDTTLVLRGSVVAVPEPGTWVLMFAGLLVVVATGARRCQQA